MPLFTTLLVLCLVIMATSAEPAKRKIRLEEVSLTTHPLDSNHRLEPPAGSSDETFLKNLRAWKHDLIGKHVRYENLRAEEDEKPWRVEGTKELHWHQPQCWTVFKKSGDLRFKKTIHRHRHEPEKHNKVYLAESRSTGQKYAIKSFHKVSEFLSEVQFLSLADHPNIVKPVCWIPVSSHNERPLLVLEWVEKGEKSGDYARKLATMEPIRDMVAQLMSVIMYAHWLGYSHSDLKPDNVMVAPDGRITVIDWGFSELITEIAPFRGTPSTYPPEKDGTVIINSSGDIVIGSKESDGEASSEEAVGSWQETLNEGADWWSFALTVLMWYGGWVNEAANSSVQFRPIRRRKESGLFEFEGCSKGVPLAVRQFVHLILQANPLERTFKNVRLLAYLQEQPLFEGLDWEKYGGQHVYAD